MSFCPRIPGEVFLAIEGLAKVSYLYETWFSGLPKKKLEKVFSLERSRENLLVLEDPLIVDGKVRFSCHRKAF